MSKYKIPWIKPHFGGSEKEYLLDALDSTWISGGSYVERFEVEVSSFSNVPFAFSVSNGTSAIHLAYLALNLKPGDEIIVPGFCYLAAANIATQIGLLPVFAEVDEYTYCVTAQNIEPLITPQTKLIVVVHTYGNVCEMTDIVNLARSSNLMILEDAAESLGSRYKNIQSGAIADIGTYSFHATKTITTGEGGMVLTKHEELSNRMRLYRSHGVLDKRYWHEVPGHNFRLTNLQAALGCAQFAQLDKIIHERKRVQTSYQMFLSDVEGVKLQRFGSMVDPVLWAQAVELNPIFFPQGRDGVIQQLHDYGIETRNGFYAASQLPIYRSRKSLPVCERLANNVISLPTFPTLTDEQIEYIASALLSLQHKP
ncbi:DegT/DnrJ/EryC1/StrS family aminotransferase [Cylindrospermopsis raciborskii]|uniref:DegT/DnrJ/EryC1/StrS family aminotransferase n=1 Tax=Cylindrospermopsis raciborskii TaxID=77022 RepID=UPI0011418BF1|nr:DegT/DnrJ/EryC1/StrS family aminotransferase [Cylindrospermopsis raciborskii]TPX27652.1 DegT/DnrJ/EryC1/StrS family aminotransferase [Cylindrospermopsis raciborskii GIHE 2018]